MYSWHLICTPVRLRLVIAAEAERLPAVLVAAVQNVGPGLLMCRARRQIRLTLWGAASTRMQSARKGSWSPGRTCLPAGEQQHLLFLRQPSPHAMAQRHHKHGTCRRFSACQTVHGDITAVAAWTIKDLNCRAHAHVLHGRDSSLHPNYAETQAWAAVAQGGMG